MAKAKASGTHSVKISKDAHQSAKRLIGVVSSLGWTKLGVANQKGPPTISSLIEVAIRKLEEHATEASK